jgi:hypothetical protein
MKYLPRRVELHLICQTRALPLTVNTSDSWHNKSAAG